MKKIFTSFFLSMLCVLAINAQDYVVEPANGSEVESLTDIFITWESAAKIDVEPTLMVGGIKAYIIEGENKIFSTDVFCGPAWGNCINLTMMNPTLDAGYYQIEIPDNMITVDGEPVAAFNLNYTIPGMGTSEAVFTLTDDNGSLNNVFITVTPCSELAVAEGNDVEYPFLVRNDGFASDRTTVYSVSITGANTATLVADQNVIPGYYTLHIPRGLFIIDGEINPLMLQDFRVSAVNKVTNDAQGATVYDLNGVQVVTNADAGVVNNLQPGIYIINGSKKLVRGNK